jgi:hypothetical protein
MGASFDAPLRPQDPYGQEWVLLLLLGVVAALAWTNVNSPRKWRLLVQAMFRMRLGRQMLREEIDLRDRTFLGLVLVAAVVVALYLWQAGMLWAGAAAFPRCLATVAVVLVVQLTMPRLTAFLFRVEHGLGEHMATGLLLFVLTGICLLPIVVFSAYQPAWREGLLRTGLGIIAVLLIYRWVRAAWIGLGEGAKPGFIFLYLCAAEAVPLALVVQALRNALTVPPPP